MEILKFQFSEVVNFEPKAKMDYISEFDEFCGGPVELLEVPSIIRSSSNQNLPIVQQRILPTNLLFVSVFLLVFPFDFVPSLVVRY